MYTLIPGTHLNWETRLSPDTICAPVLIFHLLIEGDILSNMCFAWSIEHRSALTITQQSIPIVAYWFRGIMCNAPLIDSALHYGRASVQALIMSAAHTVKLACRCDLARFTQVINAAVTGPWHLRMGSSFFRVLYDVLLAEPLVVEAVAVGPREPLSDIVIDNLVGLVFPGPFRVAEWVVLLFLIVFSDRWNYLETWRTAGPNARITAGVPPQVAVFLDTILEPKARTPPYLGQHDDS
jgi:hypothetical protein